MNTAECPDCGGTIPLDQDIEWVDEKRGICICPHCGEEVKIS